MAPSSPIPRPAAVLFACTMNAVRSPMAELLLRRRAGTRIYVASVGVEAGQPDPFATSVMAELGLNLAMHRPKAFDDLWETSFDLVITLSARAAERAEQWASGYAIELEHWQTPDPSTLDGNRDQRLAGYRALRDRLNRAIAARFEYLDEE